MTLHDMAVDARKRLEKIWFDNPLNATRYKLFAKCRGMVLGDRIENAVFHKDWHRVERGDK